MHLGFSMHRPFLRTALSQSRNYSLRRRDFACFAYTHILHNSLLIRAVIQEVRDLIASSLLKWFKPTSPASQPCVTTARLHNVPTGAPFSLPDEAELLYGQLCPNHVARKQASRRLTVHFVVKALRGEVGSWVPVPAR